MLGRDKLDKLIDSTERIIADENPDDAFVGVAMVIVEVRGTLNGSAFYTVCTDKREWIQKALVHEAQQAIEFSDLEVETDGD